MPAANSLSLNNVAFLANAGPSFVGPLDAFEADIPGAWSPARRLLTSYEGPLVRVRRTSDDTEQDIGYTAAGALDIGALASFVGVSTARVRTVYDQIGSNDLVNATSAEQPTLSASVAAWGGTPALVFAGVPEIMSLGSGISPTALLMGAHSTAFGFGRYCSDAAGNSSFFEFGPGAGWARFGNTDGQIVAAFADDNVGHGFEMWYNGASSIVRIDTAEEASAATAPLNGVQQVGAYANNTQAMIGSIPYMVSVSAFYDITNRAAIRAALGSVFPFAT